MSTLFGCWMGNVYEQRTMSCDAHAKVSGNGCLSGVLESIDNKST